MLFGESLSIKNIHYSLFTYIKYISSTANAIVSKRFLIEDVDLKN